MKTIESDILDANGRIDRDVVESFSRLQEQVPINLKGEQGAAFGLSLPLENSTLPPLGQGKEGQ